MGGAGELEVEEVCKTRRWVFKGEARSDRARVPVGRCGPWQLTSWLVATVDVEKAKLETGHVLIGAQWKESRSRTRLTLARTPWLEPLVVVTHRKAERRPARGYMAWNSREGALLHRAEKSNVVVQDYRECGRLRGRPRIYSRIAGAAPACSCPVRRGANFRHQPTEERPTSANRHPAVGISRFGPDVIAQIRLLSSYDCSHCC